MCSIFGALVRIHDDRQRHQINNKLYDLYQASHQRGRDGRGYIVIDSGSPIYRIHKDVTRKDHDEAFPQFDRVCRASSVIGNTRAEPTTEFIAKKNGVDQQPYRLGKWSVVHNGTIANDKELRNNKYPSSIDSAAIVEQLNDPVNACETVEAMFYNVIGQLKGSFAILATHQDHPDIVFYACNYRPIWFVKNPNELYLASARDYLPHPMDARMVQPYTMGRFEMVSGAVAYIKRNIPQLEKEQGQGATALVVCSGGLDSVVAATHAQKVLGHKLHLIHFCYGSRAEGPEVAAVKEVADFLGAELTIFPLPVYRKEDSPLLNADAAVAGGEAGAEFAHEWVPARNLVMLSVATAFAEARGIQTIVLGNNLEEAGAYPDNEPEFINKFNDLLPFAVGDGKRVKVIMPVGNMMKHEIVEHGAMLHAPMHLTWSCYRAGAMHCGKCGPCYMRRKAFQINNFPEVIPYVSVD